MQRKLRSAPSISVSRFGAAWRIQPQGGEHLTKVAPMIGKSGMDFVSTTADIIESEEIVRALYPAPRYLRILDHLDDACRFFVERSPLLIIGSARGGDGIDLSPRGGVPGFVRVLTDQALAIPDRPGNNRIDTMETSWRTARSDCSLSSQASPRHCG